MRNFKYLAIACLLFFMPVGTAEARVTAKIDLSSQRMTVYVDGVPYYRWRVSTGRKGYRTPTGKFRPTFMKRYHESTIYDNAPMPHSIFFNGGIAVHGTNHIRSLGRTASHGCVRLHPYHAETLYDLVKYYGIRRTRIIVKK